MFLSFLVELLPEVVQFPFLESHQGIQITVDILNFGYLFLLHGLLLLQPLQKLPLLLRLYLQIISLRGEFLELGVQCLPGLLGGALLTFGLIEVELDDLELIFLVLLVFLLPLHPYLLLGLLARERIVQTLEIVLVVLLVLNSDPDIVQF